MFFNINVILGKYFLVFKNKKPNKLLNKSLLGFLFLKTFIFSILSIFKLLYKSLKILKIENIRPLSILSVNVCFST